ncbi:hypothetical protein Ancab_017401, partial [Ancistrocladus abbreviatus]
MQDERWRFISEGTGESSRVETLLALLQALAPPGQRLYNVAIKCLYVPIFAFASASASASQSEFKQDAVCQRGRGFAREHVGHAAAAATVSLQAPLVTMRPVPAMPALLPVATGASALNLFLLQQ